MVHHFSNDSIVVSCCRLSSLHEKVKTKFQFKLKKIIYFFSAKKKTQRKTWKNIDTNCNYFNCSWHDNVYFISFHFIYRRRKKKNDYLTIGKTSLACCLSPYIFLLKMIFLLFCCCFHHDDNNDDDNTRMIHWYKSINQKWKAKPSNTEKNSNVKNILNLIIIIFWLGEWMNQTETLMMIMMMMMRQEFWFCKFLNSVYH